MGIIRSRASIEQQSSNEVEQPLLKKLCPFVDSPVDGEESETDSGGEEDEEDEESESDSEEEEDGSLTVNQECLNNNHKESMVLSEEEEDDSSESESVGDSEGSNSPKALDLLEGGGKVVQSKSTTENNGEFKSQTLCPEVDHHSVNNIVAPEDVEPESDSAEEEENSFLGDANNNYKQIKVVNEVEDDKSSESESEGDTEESEGDSEASDEQDGLDPLVKNIVAPEDAKPESDSAEEEENSFLGDTNNNYNQTKVVNEVEDGESSESESEGDTEASEGESEASEEQDGLDLEEKLRDGNKQSTVVSEKEEDGSSESECNGDTKVSIGQEDVDLGEKLSNNSNKQSGIVIEEDEDDSSGSESEGNSEASNDHEDLDLGGGEEQNKTRETQATTEKHQHSKSQESCSKIGSPKVKKSSQSSVANHDCDKEDGEEKSESDSEEEGKSSYVDNGGSKPTVVSNDNHKKTVVTMGNEEEDDESESEGDTEVRCEQEDLHLLGKKERNARRTESNVGKYVKKPRDSMPDGEKNQYHKWSDNDVITLLEGLVKIMDGGDKGKSYVLALRDLIGNSLHFKPSINQIREKIRRLRMKYVKYMRYARKSRVNLSPHEAKVVELCKTVWGNELKRKNVEESRLPSGRFRVDYSSQVTEILKEGFDFIAGSKNQSDFEEDWVKLQLQEIQVYQEKLDMMKKHLGQVTDELQASLRSSKKADHTGP